MWVVTGDGDALSIGGNHLIHALRRNVNLKILLFNNRIYGLTKGQYSPTSELGKVTKSTPTGLAGHPVQPGVARPRRRGDLRRPHHRLRPQAPDACCGGGRAHRGTALVEIYQNCNIFNDGAFDLLKDRDRGRRPTPAASSTASRSASASTATARSSSATDSGSAAGRRRRPTPTQRSLVATTRTPRTRPQRSRSPGWTTPDAGPRRRSASSATSSRPTYDDLVREQIATRPARAADRSTDDDLAALLAGHDTWTVDGMSEHRRAGAADAVIGSQRRESDSAERAERGRGSASDVGAYLLVGRRSRCTSAPSSRPAPFEILLHRVALVAARLPASSSLVAAAARLGPAALRATAAGCALLAGRGAASRSTGASTSAAVNSGHVVEAALGLLHQPAGHGAARASCVLRERLRRCSGRRRPSALSRSSC